MTRTQHARYTLTELAGLAGVTPRTVRYYTAQGLLPAVATSGPGAKYGDAQLARLRVIRRLQRDHLPLAAIRQQLEGFDDAAILTLSESPPATPPDSALDYIRRVMQDAAPRPSAASVPMPAPAVATPADRAVPASPAPASPAPASPAPASPAPASPAPASPALASRPLAIEPAPEPASALPLQRAQWERVTIAPDIELHVRRPLPRTLAKRVDRLIAIARDLLEEDPT